MACTLDLDFLRDSSLFSNQPDFGLPSSSASTAAAHSDEQRNSQQLMCAKFSSMPIPTSLKNSVSPLAPAHHSYIDNSIQFKHGTTTMAFTFGLGVLVAVDSRASMGSYVGSGTVKKIIEISPYMVGTMAGGAGEATTTAATHTIILANHSE